MFEIVILLKKLNLMETKFRNRFFKNNFFLIFQLILFTKMRNKESSLNFQIYFQTWIFKFQKLWNLLLNHYFFHFQYFSPLFKNFIHMIYYIYWNYFLTEFTGTPKDLKVAFFPCFFYTNLNLLILHLIILIDDMF